jgi:hypothetical protein
MRVAIFATMPHDAYSGGRYYSFMVAEALTAGGHEVHFCTDNTPIFYSDFTSFPDHKNVTLALTQDFMGNLPDGDFDAVFLTPGGKSIVGFYDLVELFAIDHNAHLVLINFESGNWFNALSPSPRPLSDWAPWRKASECASVVLSIAQEGDRWARDFYTSCWEHTQFDYCYPPVNTHAADSVVDVVQEKRILLFMRFSSSSHKGSDHLDQLFCDAMQGHMLVIVLGKEQVPSNTLKRLVELAKQYGVSLEFKSKLSDVEKFREIKRSTLVLFPSQFEGFGYPPVEAQYCKVNCVAFDLPVLRETCGDRLYLAESGNWSALRDKISEVLTDGCSAEGYMELIEPVASIQTATDRLETILNELNETKLPSRASRRLRLKILHSLRLNDIGIRVNQTKYRVRNFILRRAAGIVKWTHQFRRQSHRVTYFPEFDTTDALSNNYHRARWYLPFVEGICEEVLLYQSCGETIQEKPEYMASPPRKSEHIRLRSGGLRNFISLLRSDLIVIWKPGYSSRYLKFLGRFCGIKLEYVATDDLGIKEYGAYCSLIWKGLTTPDEWEAVILSNEEKFGRLAIELQAENFDRACVFGTGPSLERAHEFEYGHSLNIVCNSIVQNDELLDLLKPKFICAADVVSHLGVSAYAHQFREDLFKVLRERDITFVTTANFGALILYHYPEFEDQIILLPQIQDGPNFDLMENFGTPRLDSTLNIQMLPLAATFAKTIWILGCDGKNPAGENEDFWAHAGTAQYHDLVDSGHLCHPTFDVHRQLSTYERFLKSTAQTIEEGEEKHGILYASLAPSYIPALASRQLD